MPRGATRSLPSWSPLPCRQSMPLSYSGCFPHAQLRHQLTSSSSLPSGWTVRSWPHADASHKAGPPPRPPAALNQGSHFPVSCASVMCWSSSRPQDSTWAHWSIVEDTDEEAPRAGSRKVLGADPCPPREGCDAVTKGDVHMSSFRSLTAHSPAFSPPRGLGLPGPHSNPSLGLPGHQPHPESPHGQERGCNQRGSL